MKPIGADNYYEKSRLFRRPLYSQQSEIIRKGSGCIPARNSSIVSIKLWRLIVAGDQITKKFKVAVKFDGFER